uniref:Ricin B lectin domain-containing protein n=1 Tax=Romanomermis culicivorax TaxID=13658 RepID=A0A915JI05_ROMCU
MAMTGPASGLCICLLNIAYHHRKTVPIVILNIKKQYLLFAPDSTPGTKLTSRTKIPSDGLDVQEWRFNFHDEKYFWIEPVNDRRVVLQMSPSQPNAPLSLAPKRPASDASEQQFFLQGDTLRCAQEPNLVVASLEAPKAGQPTVVVLKTNNPSDSALQSWTPSTELWPKNNFA